RVPIAAPRRDAATRTNSAMARAPSPAREGGACAPQKGVASRRERASHPFSLCGDSQITVAVGDDLAVLTDLNGVAIEHGDAEAATAKFHRAIRRRDPAFKWRLGGIIIDCYSHIGFL